MEISTGSPRLENWKFFKISDVHRVTESYPMNSIEFDKSIRANISCALKIIETFNFKIFKYRIEFWNYVISTVALISSIFHSPSHDIAASRFYLKSNNAMYISVQNVRCSSNSEKLLALDDCLSSNWLLPLQLESQVEKKMRWLCSSVP